MKRRAYDALTVLIACEVIDKRGKEIMINPRSPINQSSTFSFGRPPIEPFLDLWRSPQEMEDTRTLLQSKVVNSLAKIKPASGLFPESWRKAGLWRARRTPSRSCS